MKVELFYNSSGTYENACSYAQWIKKHQEIEIISLVSIEKTLILKYKDFEDKAY